MRHIITLMLIVTALTGCATNPVTGKNELTLVSRDQEINIGNQQYLPTQQSQGGQYTADPALARYVQEVGARLAAVSDSPLPYEFVVLNDSTPNAWAMPGGKIAINRGLLTQLENEAELAAVLGHEIVHAAARHSAKAMERSMLLQGAVLLTAVGAQSSESPYANYVVGAATLGAQLVTHRYGREAELESDYYGMQYMAAAGYDPAAAITLQEKFVALSQGRTTGWIEGLFASHPPSTERVAKNRLKNETLKAAQNRDWELGQQRYSQELSYLNSKSSAYQAYDQARTLLANNEPDSAQQRLEKAIAIEPREARFFGLQGDIAFAREQLSEAVDAYTRALELDENYYHYYLGRGMTLSKLGQRDLAKVDLQRSTELLPTALAANELGGLALAAGNRQEAKRLYQMAAGAGGNVGQQAAQAFKDLDFADNPGNYFNVAADRYQNQIRIIVQNGAGRDVADTRIQVSVVINGENRRATFDSGPINAGQRIGINTGWSLGTEDQVSNWGATVTDVTL